MGSRDVPFNHSLKVPFDYSEDANSVNWDVPVNRERSRDSAILVGVGARKLAILDVDLAGRDEQLGPAVNYKPQKTRDLNEKSQDSRLGFLCLPDWLSFEPIQKGSSGRTRRQPFHFGPAGEQR